ncbi:hypothetical protein [Nocardioides sp.]|uniref:hypothetical protein n=1 Tax=Nocardioides sp. TaxID=35761 RepID=UPI000C8CB3D8|nr:hypothetical protein [Nocardioides sp.]MAS55162.1 hypothetical protein [Pimelobacter sp.]MDE0775600.1 hypothetical protein [Nocardioides sp.]
MASLRPRLAPRRVVPLLTILVLIGSALSLALALTRPDPRPPADLPGVAAGAGGYRSADLEGAGGPAVQAMVELLPIALSYDFRDLPGGLDEATDVMTPTFAKAFTASFNSSARPLARRQRAVAQAQVRGAGLVRVIDSQTVLALSFVDQVLVQSRTQGRSEPPRVLTRNRVLVRLARVDGDWLIANISPI